MVKADKRPERAARRSPAPITKAATTVLGDADLLALEEEICRLREALVGIEAKASALRRRLASAIQPAAEVRTNSDTEDAAPERIAYTINELAGLLGVCRRTIEKKIASGYLASTKRLGRRLVSAASVKALFEPENVSK